MRKLAPITNDIVTITGPQPGPVVAIFAGVHGNERAGVYALQQLIPDLKITKGTVHFAFANPPAIEANVRMVTKNLNRCFYAGNDGTDAEDIRARELMQVLDSCDALLDLHMFYDKKNKPFVICEDNAVDIAQRFDVDIISTNWTEVEPGGTDGYMYQNGKIGICVECGPLELSEEYTDFAIQTVYQFLNFFDMTNKLVPVSVKKKRLVKAIRAVNKTSPSFVLTPGMYDFQKLTSGQVLATDGEDEFTAQSGECIIFPHYAARVGEEAYIIGQEIGREQQ